jgi:DNA-directed RNA polymerase specialized sigma24 family protein
MQTDRSPFDQLYAAHVRVVRQYIYYRCEDPHLADQLTARAFLRAWELFGPTPPQDIQPRRWLLRLARTILLEHRQTQQTSRGRL